MGSDLNVGHTVAMSEQIGHVGSGGQGGRQGRDSCVASSQTSFLGNYFSKSRCRMQTLEIWFVESHHTLTFTTYHQFMTLTHRCTEV